LPLFACDKLACAFVRASGNAPLYLCLRIMKS
jgi:hypothetical protein